MTPAFEAYQANLRRIGRPLMLGGLGLILVGACLLIASKGEADASLRLIGFVMLGLGWGLWGYVWFVKKRWERVNPFTGPRE